MAQLQQQERQREEQSVSIPLQHSSSYGHWRQIFDKYDRDHDGKVSYCELKAIIDSREYEKDIPDPVVRKIMQTSDTDGSGYLDLQEFIAMVHRPELQGVFGHLVSRYIHSIIPSRSPVDVTGTRTRREVGAYTAASQREYDEPDGLYEEEYSCNPPAVCMIIVSLVEIFLFCYDAAMAHGNTQATGPVARVLIYNPYKRFEAWRFITYMFVHVGSVHLVVNLLVQLLLGLPLEMVHRWWRVLIVYSAGVAAGSLGTSLTDPTVFLAGASGGVYALIAAHIATIIMNWKHMEFAVLQLLVFLVLASLDIGTAVYNRYILDLDENIGYVAHLAGALAGLLVGIGILRNLQVSSWEKKLWWGAVVIYFVLMFAGILANIFWVSHFPEARRNYK